MENEQGRYLSVDVLSCDVSNNPDPKDLDPKDPDKRGIVNYYSEPSPQFENVENFGNVVSSDWNSWLNYNTANSSGEFVVGQVFSSKVALQDAIKLYSIKAHQQYVVVISSKKLLVLRCKKVKECQCTWKLRAMVVKGTSFWQSISIKVYILVSMLS